MLTLFVPENLIFGISVRMLMMRLRGVSLIQ